MYGYSLFIRAFGSAAFLSSCALNRNSSLNLIMSITSNLSLSYFMAGHFSESQSSTEAFTCFSTRASWVSFSAVTSASDLHTLLNWSPQF